MSKKGDIVMLNFPFSDFKNFKLRPVLVWENLGDDLIIMPITSNKINNFGEFFYQKILKIQILKYLTKKIFCNFICKKL